MRTKRQNFFLILMLGILYALTPISIDMYLPAFPQIASDLKTTVARASFSVSSYFIGYALGQIFYGPLLDRFGRKNPLYVGLGIYILASIGCYFSNSIEMLLAFRFLQALGGCGASVSATAMVRDFFPVKDSAKVYSLLMLVLSVSPLLAPSIGSVIVTSFGWRIVFGVLTLLAAAVIAMLYFFLPEGSAPNPNVALQLRPIWNGFKEILFVPEFYIYTLAGSFSFAGLFVYVAGSPAIFMDSFHVSAHVYGGIFAFLAIGMIGGGQLNLLLTRRFSNRQIFRTALVVQTGVGGLFLLGTLTADYSLPVTIAFLFILLSCAGVTSPNAAAIALAPFSKNAGSASALMGFLQLSLGALTSGIVGLLNIKGTLPTSATMAVSAAIGLVIVLRDRPVCAISSATN